MATLTWNDSLTLQQPRMDSTHAEFVQHLATLESALNAPLPAIDAALAALLTHTEDHFAQEERWMAALGFAAENCHAYQHAHVLQVLRDVNRLWLTEGDLNLVRQLVGELAKWFPVHAQSMDAGLAMTMAQRGFNPDTGALAVLRAPDASPMAGCGSAACTD